VNASANHRRLGLFSATALVVSSMLGTGVFTTSGFLLADIPSPGWVLMAWLVGAVLAACGALSYGALARRMPESGGEYLFMSRTLHPAAGNVAGWVSVLVGFSAPQAAAAYGFGEYLKVWWSPLSSQASGTLLIAGLGLIHALHVEGGNRLHNFTVGVEILLIFIFAALALSRLPVATWEVPVAVDVSPGAFALGLVWVSFSYAGWNAAVYVAGEVRDPERTLPRALLAGTALVTVLYLALNAAFLYSAPPDMLAGKLDIGRVAAQSLGGEAWANTLSGLVALVLAASVSAMTIAGPRVFARMARDGYLPRAFGVHTDNPRGAIALQCALALVLLWSATFKSLLTYIGFTLNLCAAATVVGLIRLKLKEGTDFPVVGWPLAPAVFLAGVLWMVVAVVTRQPVESLWGLATLALGGASWWWKRSSSG